MAKQSIRNVIVLENERTEGISKKVNELGNWKFFKVIYNNSMFRILGLNLFMLICLIPAVYFYLQYNSTIYNWGQALPFANSLGIGYNPWLEVGDFSVQVTNRATDLLYLQLLPCILLLSVAFSGSYACLRDSYWTGQLRLIKPFFRGIAQTIPYSLILTAVLGGGFFGMHMLQYALVSLPNWLNVVVNILAWTLLALIAIYGFLVLSVAAVYKQSPATNLKTSWHLMWSFFLSHVFYFACSLLPFILLFVTGSLLQSVVLAVFVLFGMFCVSFIWMIHMMRIFALFHPVSRKKVKNQ